MKSIKYYLTILLILFSATAFAEDSLQGLNLLDDLGFGGQDDILDVDDAFKLTTENSPNNFIARFVIAEGHYLYRDKMQITTDDEAVKPGSIKLPAS